MTGYLNFYPTGLDKHMTDFLEKMAKWLQLKIMKKPQGMERIEDGALYFHPNDIRGKVLESYRKKVRFLISP